MKKFKPIAISLGHLQDPKQLRITELKKELAELEADND
jgi:hypothetical protein